MGTMAHDKDHTADLVFVSRAEADVALDGFPAENPFKHVDESKDASDAVEWFPVENPFKHLPQSKDASDARDHVDGLISESDATIQSPARQDDKTRARRYIRLWMVAAVAFLATAFAMSMPFVRTTLDGVASPAPTPTQSPPETIAAPEPVVAPPVSTGPPADLVTLPPALDPVMTNPSGTQPLAVGRNPSTARDSNVARGQAGASGKAPIPTEPILTEPLRTEARPTEAIPSAARPPSAALDLASGATPLPAASITLGGFTAPPPPPARTTAPATSPAPAVSTAATSAAGGPPSRGSADASAVQAVLDRYARAFSALDVEATGAIWPDVDTKALARSFDQLDRQSVVLSGCEIRVSDDLADASCAGQMRYVPKIGRKSERVASHQWTFTLRKMGAGWFITSVRSK